jgi:hypothetical protein
MSIKIPMTPSEIETMAFQPVAQSLNRATMCPIVTFKQSVPM